MKTLLALAASLCLGLTVSLVGCSDTTTNQPEPMILTANNMVEAEISGMDCGGCVYAVSTAVKQIDGVSACRVDLKTGKVSVALEDNVDADAAAAEIQTAIAGLSDGKFTVNSIAPVDKPMPEAAEEVEDQASPADPADAA